MKLPQALPGLGLDIGGCLAMQGVAGSPLEPPGLLGEGGGTHTTNCTQSWAGTAPTPACKAQRWHPCRDLLGKRQLACLIMMSSF